MSGRGTKQERMLALVERWGRSGQSAAAFCRRHGMSPQTLSYWKKRASKRKPRGRTTATAGGRGVPAAFVPIRVGAGEPGHGWQVGADRGDRPAVEVLLPGGTRVIAYERPWAEELLALVRERC